jgi:hypothetical protein
MVSLKNAEWLETLVDLRSAMQFWASAMRHSVAQIHIRKLLSEFKTEIENILGF